MLKKVIWILISCLIVLSLVMASCSSNEDTGGKVIEEDTGAWQAGLSQKPWQNFSFRPR